MAATSELKSEISKLKSDAEEKRPRRRRSRAAAGKTAAQTAPDTAPAPDQQTNGGELEELAHKLKDLVGDAEQEIRERPVATVLGAFALGVVVGALLRR